MTPTGFFRKIAFLVFVSCMGMAHIDATSRTNYAEMGLALATIPFDMAAQHKALNNNEKDAALLHFASTSLSILHKCMFFYNNAQCEESQPFERALVVNGLFMGRDLTKWFSYLRQLASAHAVHEETGIAPAKEYSKLQYTMQVRVLPILKGLTACALAYAQDESQDNFCGLDARNLAAAAHSLTRLIDEYTALDNDSSYKLPLIALIIANAGWIAVEIKNYKESSPNELRPDQINQRGGVVPLWRQRLGAEDDVLTEEQDITNFATIIDEQENYQPIPPVVDPVNLPVTPDIHQCPVCWNDNNLNILACGHQCCINCLSGHVQQAVQGNGNANIHCPERSCNHNNGLISQGEIRGIMQQANVNDRVINLYDRLLRRLPAGAHKCPTPNCNHNFSNHNRLRASYTCPDCSQTYCANCTTPHERNVSCLQGSINALTQEERNNLYRSENRTLCPRCFVSINRTEGCPHMGCGNHYGEAAARRGAGCGYQFCLYCHERYPNHAPGCNSRLFSQTPDHRHGH